MEKNLLKKYYKTGEFSINYIPKTFMIGFTKSSESSYLVIGCVLFEWFPYLKSKSF
jgi:hypothetical protein